MRPALGPEDRLHARAIELDAEAGPIGNREMAVLHFKLGRIAN